jgi:hypothetical protein
MSKVSFLLTLLVAVLVALLPAAPAQAQSIRTFVSTSGSDNPSCSLASPCRHFQAAVAATALGGEVDVLDPGAYGSFTISQAISIEGQGWSYVAPPSGGAAITINAVSGNVNIRGVSLNGVGVASATGIQFNSGTTLNVQNSVIRNFSSVGIAFAPTSSTASQLFVSNTLVSDNGGNGISLNPSGSGSTTGVLDHVTMENNVGVGLNIGNFTQYITMTVSDSVSANNGGGISAYSGGGTPVSIMVRNSTIANNSGDGLGATGTGATIRVTRSTITGNATGWATLTSGIVLSYGDNNIDGNGSANTEPPSPLTYK